MRVASTLMVTMATALAGCQAPHPAREVQRLVPLGVAVTTPSAPDGGVRGANGHPAAAQSPGVQPSQGPRSGDGGAAAVVTITDRTAPGGALGVRWGMTRAEVTAASRTAGVPCRESAEYLFCPRALVPVPTGAVATYEFCSERLCAVALDGVRTRDEARIASDYGVLLGVMQGELGPPATATRRVGPGCAGHLALCLTSRQAELRARWSWRDGSQAMVAADQDEADAFIAQVSATYLSPERARRNDPEPPPYLTLPSDAGVPPR